MIPVPILEHAVTVMLKSYDDMEMILLKGHLVLEQMLNQLLVAHGLDEKRLSGMNLMFGKTLDLVLALDGRALEELYPHLRKVNRIRNKVAHELFFEKYHNDLKEWASDVLGYKPKTIDSKRTYKNHVIKAFTFVVGALQGAAIAVEAANGSNKRLRPTREGGMAASPVG